MTGRAPFGETAIEFAKYLERRMGPVSDDSALPYASTTAPADRPSVSGKDTFPDNLLYREENTVKVSNQQVQVHQKTAELKEFKGGARALLREMAADLVKPDGSVRSGYLRLKSSGDQVHIKAGHLGSGASAATDLVKKLVGQAYGSEALAAVEKYIEDKGGKNKVGTLSFVKLVQALEGDTAPFRDGEIDHKIMAARGTEAGRLDTSALRSFKLEPEVAAKLGVDFSCCGLANPARELDGHRLTGLKQLYGEEVRLLGNPGAEGAVYEIKTEGHAFIYKGFNSAEDLVDEYGRAPDTNGARLGDIGLTYSEALRQSPHLASPSEYVLGFGRGGMEPEAVIKLPASRIKDLAKDAAAGRVPAGLQLFGVLMPKAPGLSLDQYPGPFSSQQLKQTARGFYGGLSDMAAHGMVHKDIKLENAVLAEDGQLKIIDFGQAEKLSKSGGPDGGPQKSRLRGGTPGYTIPWKSPKSSFGPEADRYSFGITMLAALVKGAPPDAGEPPSHAILIEALKTYERTADQPENLLADVLTEVQKEAPQQAEQVRTAMRNDPALADFLQRVFESSLPGAAGDVIWSQLKTHPFLEGSNGA